MLNTIGTDGRRSVKRDGKKLNATEYARLLSESLPVIIETEKENRRLLAIARGLMRKGESRTLEETSLLKLLAHLIQDFEQRFYQIPKSSPREILKELMNANRLKQVDLIPIFGTKSVVSEVLSGKRSISKAQA